MLRVSQIRLCIRQDLPELKARLQRPARRCSSCIFVGSLPSCTAKRHALRIRCSYAAAVKSLSQIRTSIPLSLPSCTRKYTSILASASRRPLGKMMIRAALKFRGKRPIASWTGAAAVKKLWRLSQPRSLQDDHSVPPHQLGLLLLRVA